MITIDIERHGLAAIDDEDDLNAAYAAAKELTKSVPADAGAAVDDVRVLIEVQRRLGGIMPRALLGGRFVFGVGQTTQVEVAVAGFDMLNAGDQPTCRSRLSKRPFSAGLPEDFGDVVLRGLAGGSEPPLPAGILRVDRAGFDTMNSAEPIFVQAAALLRISIAAALWGQDPEPNLRRAIESW